jgi:hypothetical protein
MDGPASFPPGRGAGSRDIERSILVDLDDDIPADGRIIRVPAGARKSGGGAVIGW